MREDAIERRACVSLLMLFASRVQCVMCPVRPLMQVSTLVEGAKEEAQTASDTMRATLASLGLPASLQASNTDAGLPDSVWVEITSVQAKGGGAALEAGLRANQENNREFMQLLDEATVRPTNRFKMLS